jgi:hypothetical protein
MRVYDGANWIAASSAGGASLLEYKYTATSGQTTFSGADDNANSLSYTQDNLIVTLNGVVLENGTDYTATTGTSVVLASGAATSDELNVIAFKTFTTADMVAASTGGTFYGDVAVTGDLTVDTNTLYVDSTNNRVGIGTSSPSAALDVSTSGSTKAAILDGNGVDITHPTLASHLFLGTQTGSDVKIESVGAYPMLFRTNSTEAMRITSSGSVGIGTSSPSTTLHIYDAGAGGDGTVHIGGTSSAATGQLFYEVSGATYLRLRNTYRSTNANAYMEFDAGYHRFLTGTGGTERMRITSAGDLLVGTTSDYAENVQAAFYGASNGGIALASGTSGLSRLMFADGVAGTAGAYVGSIIYSHSDDSMRFNVNGGSERMRIDSSGNVLVGTTSTTPHTGTSTGVAIRNDGGVFFTRANSDVLNVNRTTSDGAIAQFRKDGTVVGSIGNSGNDFYVTGSVSNIAGVTFANSKMMPMKSGSLADGQSDLGSSSYRWRDLYLSGGVYLGGTGSSNKLDDYEEGTWTIGVTIGGAAQTVIGPIATYTKIGNTVSIRLRVGFSKSGSGVVNITGLPFASSFGSTVSVPIGCQVGSVTSTAALFANIDAATTIVHLADQAGDLTDADLASTAYIFASFTYQAG